MVVCNLGTILRDKKMSITTCSQLTGISRTTLTALTKGTSKGVSLSVIDRLCTELNIKPSDLFRTTDIRKSMF